MQTDVDGLPDRLRVLADRLALSERDDVTPVVEMLYEAADAVGRPSDAKPPSTVALCGRREHGEPCDRVRGHEGDHSPELRRLRRIAREYDVALREVRDARHAANVAESRVHYLEQQVKQLAKRTSWLARLLRRR